MLIDELSKTAVDQHVQFSCRVRYEDSDRPAAAVKLFLARADADLAVLNPDTFLAGCMAIARRHGERRIRLDDPVCPVLQRNLVTVLHWHHEWYGAQSPIIAIEGPVRAHSLSRCQPPTAAVFLSGGVDSLYTLTSNRERVPRGNPASIDYGIIVNGYDIKDDGYFDRSEAATTAVASTLGVRAMAVRSSLRALEPDDDFWSYEFHGLALAAVGFMFVPAVRFCYISASEFALGTPWGTSPEVDAFMSSAEIRMIHEGAELNRLEKLKHLERYQVALDNVRVCFRPPAQGLNCGKCEKCVRTRIGLLANGATSAAFPADEVLPSDIASITFTEDYHVLMYECAIPGLRAVGRDDLIAAIAAKAAEYSRWRAWKDEKDWKGRLRRADRTVLNGALTRAYRRFR